MLHVRIRSPHDAFHFIGEVNAYNLQTVRQHVRQGLRENGRLTLSVQIDPSDEPLFSRYAAAWVRELAGRGTAVQLDAGPPRMVVKLTAA